MKVLCLCLSLCIASLCLSCESEQRNDITFVNKTDVDILITHVMFRGTNLVLKPDTSKTFNSVGANNGNIVLSFQYELNNVSIYLPDIETMLPEIYLSDGEHKTVTIYDDHYDVD